MRQYMPFSPVEIMMLSKEEAVKYLLSLTSDNGRTLVLASDRRVSTLGLDQLNFAMKKDSNNLHISNIPTNPTISDVYESLKYLQHVKIDRIIAIGGGSCIDLAKAISSLHNLIPADMLSKQNVYSIIKNKEYLKAHDYIDIIAVPTTSGTGSEVTKWATIWDMEQKEKLSIDCTQIFPKAALLVPEFTLSMPVRLTLSTGLDALCHAMEAFWARSRTPLSQVLAISAIEHIKEYLPKVISDGSNIKFRQKMCLASLLAGLAFSITRTTACHSISYPLTMFYGVEHGFAAAITLAPIAERNERVVTEIRNVYSIFGGKDKFTQWIKETTCSALEFKLSTFGICKNDLDFIVEKTFTQGRMDNNPIVFTSMEVKDILQRVL